MTYPRPFLRLVASGTLYAVESWSWSLSMIPDFDNTPTAPEEVPAGVITAVQTFHTSAGIGSDARLNTVKLNEIDANGRYVDQDSTVLHDYALPGVAGTGPSGLVPQIAWAVTLRTAATRGLAHSGRFYVPLPAVSVAEGGVVGTSAAVALADDAATLINDLNAAVPGWRVGVVSDVRTGAARPVTRVEVGRVLDTVRSRRTNLPENHQQATVAIA